MSFKANIETIREQARQHMMEGAVTASYAADRDEVCRILNDVLATEIVCTLRYRNNYYKALELGAHRVADEFAEHAAEEQGHQDKIAERITQLGAMPNFDPAVIAERSHASYSSKDDLIALLEENLVAERVAVSLYGEIVRWLGTSDPTTRRMMEEILEQEEEHADDLVDLISRVKARETATARQ